MTFIALSPQQPIARASETVDGFLGGGLGARFVMEGAASGGRVALVEHPIVPRGLAAPLHLHTREDEFSFILEGTWGFQLGEEVIYGEPGDLVFKPRHVWHSFWNAGDEPARLLEVISPAGFEHFFVELSGLLTSGGLEDPDAFTALTQRYGLEMDFDSVPKLVAAHGLVADDVDQRMTEA
ncbi:MAG: cupin domain-containing protein [Actinomycetota bacterium]|nr:cupin domain-containing protein [Actinomycetota bacterium]